MSDVGPIPPAEDADPANDGEACAWLAVGDVVVLNSGGVPMTVTKLRKKPGSEDASAPFVAADVVWMHEGVLRDATVNLRWITKID